MIAAVVLAAGEGRRFGGLKQLHTIDGRPMLEHVLAAVAQAPFDDRVLVLGAEADRILRDVPLHGARTVTSPDWRHGQAASLRAGLAALASDIETAVVVLGDGPGLQPDALDRMLDAHAAWPGEVLAADYGRGRSHPVVLPRSVWSNLPAHGEAPGRALPARPVDCRHLTQPGDIDYPV